MAAKKTETAEEVNTAVVSEPKFTKYRLLKSKTYAAHRCFLAAILEDDKTYTKAEIDKYIENGGTE